MAFHEYEAHIHGFTREKERQNYMYSITERLIQNIEVLNQQLSHIGINPSHVLDVVDEIRMAQGRIESLKIALARRKMKISVFGATSSGKSMVINALLGQDLMACGMGHTTNCFVQVEEIDILSAEERSQRPCRQNSRGATDSYLVVRSNHSAEAAATVGNYMYPLTVERLQELSDATADKPLDDSHTIEVHLSRQDHMCPLLKNCLQILDCPGISSCRKIGDRVKSICGDSDVHVLIVNASSVMSAEEKEHFINVKKRMPNPDVIIGFTQWDRSANERNPQRVKEQHLKSAYELLLEIGTVRSLDEARERCFFFSGYEAMKVALGEANNILPRGHEERLYAFHDFMARIESRASIAGKKTKLDTNRQVCQDIVDSLTMVIRTMQDLSKARSTELNRSIMTLGETQSQLDVQTLKFMEEIKRQRETALTAIDVEVNDCMEHIIRKMKESSSQSPDCRPFEEDNVHDYGEMVIHNWYALVIRGFIRSTRMVSEDYSIGVLGDYKKLFQEFPQEYPKTYLHALHEEILPKIRVHELHAKAVSNLLTGITDKGLWASFASTRRRLSEVTEDDDRSAAVRRMAAGAGVVFMRIRRWIKDSVEGKLMKRLDSERHHSSVGLDNILLSCRQAVEGFCDMADAYYLNTLDNTIGRQIKDELRNCDAMKDRAGRLLEELDQKLQQAQGINDM